MNWRQMIFHLSVDMLFIWSMLHNGNSSLLCKRASWEEIPARYFTGRFSPFPTDLNAGWARSQLWFLLLLTHYSLHCWNMIYYCHCRLTPAIRALLEILPCIERWAIVEWKVQFMIWLLFKWCIWQAVCNNVTSTKKSMHGHRLLLTELKDGHW